VSASNGLDALKILKDDHESFDLIITDLVMPNVGGIAIIAIVKQKHPGTPVIAMTGWGSDPEILASEAHADMVLGKPFKLAELEILIKQLISKNNQA
jgi:DNA-binding response OmpR family regulator